MIATCTKWGPVWPHRRCDHGRDQSTAAPRVHPLGLEAGGRNGGSAPEGAGLTAASKGAVSASCVACGPPLAGAGAQPSRCFGGSVSGALLGFGHAMAFVAVEAKGDDMVTADDDDDEFASRNDIGFDADALAVATTLSATASGACAAPTPRDASSPLVDAEIKDADALAFARNDTGDESGLTPMATPIDDEFVATIATLRVPRAIGGSEEEEPAAVVLLVIMLVAFFLANIILQGMRSVFLARLF